MTPCQGRHRKTGDTETRRQGDKAERALSPVSCLRISLSFFRAFRIFMYETTRSSAREEDVVATPDLATLESKAKSIRRAIIASTTTAASGHPTSSMSAVEIAVALYFGGVLRYDPKKPDWRERDKFILSKGHAAPLLYAVLAEAGYIAKDQLPTLRQIGSPLEGHPNMRRLPGV